MHGWELSRKRRPGRRSALRAAIVLALVAAAAVFGLAVHARSGDATKPRKADLAAAVAHNYRVLSPAQSRTLIAYSRKVYACVKSRGFPIGAPKPDRTKVVMRLNATADANVRALMACDGEVGAPPPRASLQARNGVIVLYLPRRCLLDKHAAA